MDSLHGFFPVHPFGRLRIRSSAQQQLAAEQAGIDTHYCAVSVDHATADNTRSKLETC